MEQRKDFEIQPWWTQFGGYDNGFTHPYVAGMYAVDGDGNIIKFAEAGNRGRESDQIGEEIKEAYRESLGHRGVVDKKVIERVNGQLAGVSFYAGHDIWAKHHLDKKYGGREIVEQSLPIKCIGPSTDAGAITAVLTNSDSTP